MSILYISTYLIKKINGITQSIYMAYSPGVL
uniref:Uncharacterized protein n=1 Tax=Caudovirales sp. ctIbU14 TaxID=2825761 RepID=A0A8S5NRS7_9CAUD|nr:MAG TPA: hypothetical protein [Caudovirales sp. ctIbU14]